MFIHPQSRSLVLNVRDPLALRDLLPKTSRLISATAANIAVRHTIETAQVLRALGFDAPSPIATEYSWPGRHAPFDHQRVMADVLTMHPKNFNLSDPGVGKTYATLWAADYLMSIGLVKRAVVIAPLSTIDTVWKADIFEILMHRSCALIRGDAEKRRKVMKMDVDFFITNHDALGIEEVATELHDRDDIDLLILDEASILRNPATRNYKYLRWVCERKPRLWFITGTPTPNGPTDAWGMARIINPTAVPKYAGQFKAETMVKVSNFKWVAKRGSEEAVFRALQPAVRFRKADCLTLPPVTITNLAVPLSAAQTKAYAAMRAKMAADWGGGRISAVNAADQINKLRQILCGSVRDAATGDYVTIDHAPRVAELVAVSKEAQAKVIIIVPFKGIIQELERELAQHASIGVLNGDVPAAARARVVQDFKTTPHPQWLLCHPRVMAHGLNLSEADTTIFYAPIYSNDEYQQVIERNNRTGQKHSMRVVRLGAHPLEWAIYRALDNKGITQDNILRLYERVLGGDFGQ